jgi:hypothetical protein
MGNPGQIGISHFYFGVNDVTALAQELISKGVELVEAMEAFTNSRGEIRSICVRDPDGVLIQINAPGTGG